jgi:hypothetical protein
MSARPGGCLLYKMDMSIEIGGHNASSAIYANWAVELEVASPVELTVEKMLEIATRGEERNDYRRQGRQLNITSPGRVEILNKPTPGMPVEAWQGVPWTWLDARVEERVLVLRAESVVHDEMILRVADFLLIYGPGKILRYIATPDIDDLGKIRPLEGDTWGEW